MVNQHNGFGNQMGHPMGMHSNGMNCLGMPEGLSNPGPMVNINSPHFKQTIFFEST